MMQRISIRNTKGENGTNSRVFDALVEGDEVFFEVKSKSKGHEIIALTDIMDQISATKPKKISQKRSHAP